MDIDYKIRNIKIYKKYLIIKTMENKITKQKLGKYFKTTEKALKKAKKKVNSKREKEAEEIIDMVEDYLSDAHHFEQKQDLINAFAAINYAHGWLDTGARLGIFDVKDDKLFVVK